VARDVFSRGDSAFLTGDVLVTDEYGYMYFRDRTGDTFRWRGENVSTSEVEAVVSNIIKLNDATVYGVEVPGCDGRAGMAAVVDENNSIDLAYLYTELCKKLPAYARPLFIRILQEVETTGTFKLKKVEYRKEGIDPGVVADQMFYLDGKDKCYKLLDKEVYEEIKLGKIRF
jgi:solute carrier family 27 fatty acid transporter 1/4